MSGAKIKICGLFRPCDVEYVNGAMPDYAGFVFYDKSPRNVHPSRRGCCEGPYARPLSPWACSWTRRRSGSPHCAGRM
jgi:hypothetical protein